jgi:hypothetical protein
VLCCCKAIWVCPEEENLDHPLNRPILLNTKEQALSGRNKRNPLTSRRKLLSSRRMSLPH